MKARLHILIAFLCLGLIPGRLLAQGLGTSAPDIFHSSSGSHGPNGFNQSTDPNELTRRHDPNHQVSRYSPTGKPCIAVESYVTNQMTNKNIYEHWIKASNSCGQHINLQVCYHKTQDCIVMNVPPWEAKNSVLGIYPGVKEFQYDVKEK